jgi:hypothetical protein
MTYGFRQYGLKMLDLAAVKIREILATDRKDIERVAANFWFNLPGPVRLTPNLSPSERSFSELFYGWSEIHRSCELLKHLASLPIQGVGLTPGQCVRLNVECYLNEIYILQQRLLQYLSIVYKQARRVASRQESTQVQETVRDLKKGVHQVFGQISAVRGSHVHQWRYDDEDLSRVDSLEDLVNLGKCAELRPYYRGELHKLRRKWAEFISTTNGHTEKFMDRYFARLYPVVFDAEKGILRASTPMMTVSD